MQVHVKTKREKLLQLSGVSEGKKKYKPKTNTNNTAIITNIRFPAERTTAAASVTFTVKTPEPKNKQTSDNSRCSAAVCTLTQ